MLRDIFFSKPYSAPAWFGLLPMLAGSTIFFGWKLTRNYAFAELGPIMLLIGFISVAGGMSLLYVIPHSDRAARESESAKFRCVRSILLVNIPVAIIYASIGINDLGKELAD